MNCYFCSDLAGLFFRPGLHIYIHAFTCLAKRTSLWILHLFVLGYRCTAGKYETTGGCIVQDMNCVFGHNGVGVFFFLGFIFYSMRLDIWVE